MADDFNFKNFKPTMKTPSTLGKKIDGGFSKEMRKVGLNMKNMTENNNNNVSEKKESLKKKIFNLAKMETLVYTDEYLSNIYNDLKQDAEETYGYHWNETIMNILFNEYVLNDAGYLQKYKNTKAVNKKRRGQEGSEELEKKLQDKVDDVKKDDDAKVLQRDKKMSDIKGDTSALDKVKKELGDNYDEEADDDVAAQMKKMSADADEEINELFGLGKPSVPLNTHKASKNDTYIVDKAKKTAVAVISPNIPQEKNQETAAKFADASKYEKTPWYVAVKNGIKGVPAEVTDGSMADFASDEMRFDGVPALGEGELTETTTSASSGAFVGPFPGKRKKVLDTPLWHGGSIIKSSVLKEAVDQNYLINPEGLKKYVRLAESLNDLGQMINDAPIDEAVSIKQHAEQILRQLQRMASENQELNGMPEYQELVKIYSDRAATGKVEDQPDFADNKPQFDNTKQFQQPVQEHHLSSREEKIDFILKHSNMSADQLNSMNDEQIEVAYLNAEKGAGIKEDSGLPSADDNVFLELGKLLFPDLNKAEEEIKTLAKNFVNDFPQLKGRNPKDILNLVKNSTANVAESSMLDDRPDSMVNTPETSMAKTMDSEELNVSGVPADGTQPVTESINKTTNMNEERKTPSMLNKEKINKETAALTKKDLANSDALKQAEVYPNPDEFYIEQDLDKVQKDAKTAEEIEKAALAKVQPKDSGLKNVGDSTNAQGNEIPKRNLTKDEMLALAMNRGDGMHNIVYDNKPSQRFEDRLKQDMGEDQYKLRQEKMKYKEDMPMYNKESQPTESGNAIEQDNKFKKGFNNESFTGKYTDDFGKNKLVEFVVDDVAEVESVNEGYKLNLEGLGNKYTQKINENKNFADIVNEFDFYLVENTVVKTKKTTGEAAKGVINENLKKMEHLMGYNSKDFVNTKKSVKF